MAVPLLSLRSPSPLAAPLLPLWSPCLHAPFRSYPRLLKSTGPHHPVPLRRLSLRCCRTHTRPRPLSLSRSEPESPTAAAPASPNPSSRVPRAWLLTAPSLLHNLVPQHCPSVGLGPDALLPLFVLHCQGPRLTGSSVYLPMICGDCPSEAFVSAAGPTARPSPSTSGTAPRLQPGNARLFRPPGARPPRAGADFAPTRG